MGQAFYRSYRPRKLADVVGQEHITEALQHALKKGTISHAYLFTGPRGVGKTSVARILAHEVNGLPYDDDSIHLDIIETDAASNRGIEEIRDLREKVNNAPSSAKYKVYIVDEVHMLTTYAFNALLKTLEEPPAHVIFILATTEVHKLPETIISRTQRYAFKPVDKSKVIDHLRYLSNQEKIDITDDALKLIAEHGEGSFRDSISLLDQIRNRDNKIIIDDVRNLLGVAPDELIDSLVESISNHDGINISVALQSMQEQGYEPVQVAKQLGQNLRKELLAGNNHLSNADTIQLLSKLVMVPASHDPKTTLELDLLGVALDGVPSQSVSKSRSSLNVTQSPVTSTVPERPLPQPEKKAEEKVTVTARKTNNTTDSLLDEKDWENILNTFKGQYNTLYGMAKVARPTFVENELILELDHAFHVKQISEVKNKKIIADAVNKFNGQDVKVTAVLADNTEKREIKADKVPKDKSLLQDEVSSTAKNDNTLNSISNIFGEAELLES